jgi:hypothetical protein
MVINNSLGDSYIINGDGSQKSDVQITLPNNVDSYTYFARSAVVAGQLHLFGGSNVDVRKVSLLLFSNANVLFRSPDLTVARLSNCPSSSTRISKVVVKL